MGLEAAGEFPDLESMRVRWKEKCVCVCAGKVGIEGPAMAENPYSFWNWLLVPVI